MIAEMDEEFPACALIVDIMQVVVVCYLGLTIFDILANLCFLGH
jgi:hypothetical protein